MGDRTAFQLVILDGSPAVLDLVSVTIDAYGLSEEWGSNQSHQKPAVLGRRYVDDEASIGITGEIKTDLAAIDDGSLGYVMWEDPKYEWLGDLVIVSPTLGVFDHPCDAEGNPVFRSDEVLHFIKETPVPFDIGEKLGLPWEEYVTTRLRELGV